jgi:cellulose synthase/poly-beta-1,6-N-acetylglucosamine synthase-like glycosyltransferase
MLSTLSVLIPAKNEEKVIGKCLDSLLSSDYPPDKLEILVNVNGSSDNTYEICKKYKKVKTIKTPAKKNRGEALNELIAMARGEIIGIFDADTFVEKDCLKEAAKRFSDEDVMGVSGHVKSVRNSMVSKAISLEKSFFYFLQHIFSNKMGYNSFFIGKNMFIRKNVFEKLGHLDTTTFVDDAEFSMRMRKHNYKIVFECGAIAWDQEPESVGSYYKQRSRWSRAILKLSRIKSKEMSILPEMIHGIVYSIAPAGIITLAVVAFLIIFNINQLLILPFLFLFSFMTVTMAYSKIFYNDPVTDFLYFPVWFFLTTLYMFVIFPKTFIEEKLNKKLIWQDLERR